MTRFQSANPISQMFAWVLLDEKLGRKEVEVYKMRGTPVRRHVTVRGNSPDSPERKQEQAR